MSRDFERVEHTIYFSQNGMLGVSFGGKLEYQDRKPIRVAIWKKDHPGSMTLNPKDLPRLIDLLQEIQDEIKGEVK